MATRRGKTQARRNHGNGGGLPGWAWGAIGLLLGVALILGAPRLLRSDGDGFFRPRPNPDAEPAPVAVDETDVVAADDDGASAGTARPVANGTGTGKGADKGVDKGADYDFYTLLPGKEVAISDAELAATERAETRRAALPAAATATAALPPPLGTGAEVVPAAAPVPSAVPPATTKPVAAPVATAAAAPTASDNTRYLLQAGAFQASGQAEELKARIALLGLGARVESASIAGKTVYRVRMGPYGTAGDLAEAKRKLASGGLPGMAIKVQ